MPAALLLTVLALLLAAPAAHAAEPAFTSSPVSRYGGDQPGAGLEDGAGRDLRGPTADVAKIPVRIRPSRAVCDARRARWFLDGAPLSARRPDPPAQQRGSCAWTLAVSTQGVRRLAVDTGSGRRERAITVDDRLVVVLGDSVASGEGNPRPRGKRGSRVGVWLERRCHRSAASGFEGAARRVARRSEQATSITFVSLACSGATIPTGVRGSYRGIEPPKTPRTRLRPQIKRLAELAERRGGVDAVMVSVGANDVGFGRVVALCAAGKRCAARLLDGRPASETVPRLLAALDGRYADLAGDLGEIVGDPRDVLLTEYFDPTRDRAGEYCTRSLGLARRDDLRWAEQSLLLGLNDAGRAAARRHRWSYVGQISARFRNHGYCARGARWVVRIGESLLKSAGSPVGSRTKGTMHPNAAGHVAIAEQIAPRLAARLGLPEPIAPARAAVADPEASEDEGSGGLGWLWYVLAALVGIALLGPTLLRVLWWAARWTAKIVGALLALAVGLVIALALCAGLVAAAIPLALWFLTPGPAKRLVRSLRADTARFWAAAGRRTVRAISGMGAWGQRISLLFRPSRRSDPVPPPEPGAREEPVPWSERTWTQLLAVAGKAVGGVLTGGGIVLLLGAMILWVRFGAVGVPAGQAVNAAGEREWLVTGWHALILFALLAGFAVLLTHALDRDATCGRPTRRGLLLVLVLELLAAVAIGDFGSEQTLQLAVGFALAAFLVHLLVDHALGAGTLLRRFRLDQLLDRIRRWLVGTPARHRRRKMAWRLVALLPLVGALAAAAVTDRSDRPLFIVPALVLAAILFTTRWGIAESAEPGTAASVEPIETPRILLAGTTLACLAILLARDELWLFGAAVAAVTLAIGCLLVAAASGRRFAPYAIAVMVSVPLYGAVLQALRAVDRPELQPLAAVTEAGRAVCGVYVGRTDGRIWYAALDLEEDVPSNRTERLRGRLTSIPDGERTSLRIAPMQSLADAQVRAVQLRDELLGERGRQPGGPTCTTEASEPVSPTAREAELRRVADALAPELLVARRDGFPPVSVQTMFALRDRRRQLCRRVDDQHCLRVTDQGRLPWSGGTGQYLDYPAKPDSRRGQRASLLRTLGTADPERGAVTYFLVSGQPGAPLSVQHWFFYPYNYQRVDVRPGKVVGGFHEGDFETVGLLTTAAARPRYVWMARHDDEGRVFGWNETALQTEGDHVRVHVARGSHASYERCGRHVRPVGDGRVDDRVPCQDADLLHLGAGATRRVDLARTGWPCWQGRFGQSGETVIERLPQVVNQGPLSPLWQQRFGGLQATPCRGVPDPGNRQGPAEEVTDARTAARLRAGAGQLTPLVDDCSDWERPQLEGVYIVACDDESLDDYVSSGFERPGPARVRIRRPDDPAPRSEVPDVPAVQRDHDALRPAAWRITTPRTARVTVFVSCRQGSRVLDARFEDVRLRPGRRYRVDDRGPEVWRLRSGGGEVDAQATPAVDGAPAGAIVDCSARPRVR